LWELVSPRIHASSPTLWTVLPTCLGTRLVSALKRGKTLVLRSWTECLRLSLLSTTCSQESDNRHGLSLTTSGVRSCMFGSGIFWLHTTMFQTSTYMEYMYVRLFEFMTTPLYVHITQTQHTHACTHNTHTTHQGFAHACLGLDVCIF